MAYQRLNLSPGTVLTSEHIKHLEDGIAEALSRIPRNQIYTYLTYKDGKLKIHLNGLEEAMSSDGLTVQVHYTSNRKPGRRRWATLSQIGGLGLAALNDSRNPDEYTRQTIPSWMSNSGLIQHKFVISSKQLSAKCVEIDLTTWLLDGLRDMETGRLVRKKVATGEQVNAAWLIGTPGGGRKKTTGVKKLTQDGAVAEFAFAIHDARGKQLGPWINTIKVGGQEQVEIDSKIFPNTILLTGENTILRSSLYVKVT